MNDKPHRLWAIIIIAIVIVIAVGLSIGLSRYRPAHAVEIQINPEQTYQGSIEIGGNVANPGIYPFSSTDSLDSVLKNAGFTFRDKENALLELNVVDNASTQPQRININLADEWLLEALPGIGSTKAKAIIVYREQNGLFRHTSELMKVEGIGQSLYDQIKGLITVTD
jgi:competence protein ComEA